MRSETLPDLPSDNEVRAARRIYAAEEPRDLAYNVARHLIEASYAGDPAFSRGDGVAVLLMSWNSGFYRFRLERMRSLVADLDALIEQYDGVLSTYRRRTVADYDRAADALSVQALYSAFVEKLWPVGTAKALHVLAPRFFPIWDTRIARAFHLQIFPREGSVKSYLAMIEIGATFTRRTALPDPLKALDEWAYVKYTLQK